MQSAIKSYFEQFGHLNFLNLGLVFKICINFAIAGPRESHHAVVWMKKNANCGTRHEILLFLSMQNAIKSYFEQFGHLNLFNLGLVFQICINFAVHREIAVTLTLSDASQADSVWSQPRGHRVTRMERAVWQM